VFQPQGRGKKKRRKRGDPHNVKPSSRGSFIALKGEVRKRSLQFRPKGGKREKEKTPPPTPWKLWASCPRQTHDQGKERGQRACSNIVAHDPLGRKKGRECRNSDNRLCKRGERVASKANEKIRGGGERRENIRLS